MSISKIRSILYFLARILGDINAVRRGRIVERVARRATGRVTGKFLQRLFNNIFRR